MSRLKPSREMPRSLIGSCDVVNQCFSSRKGEAETTPNPSPDSDGQHEGLPPMWVFSLGGETTLTLALSHERERGLDSRLRGNDGSRVSGVLAESEQLPSDVMTMHLAGDGFRPRIGVRGKLSAGMTEVEDFGAVESLKS